MTVPIIKSIFILINLLLCLASSSIYAEELELFRTLPSSNVKYIGKIADKIEGSFDSWSCNWNESIFVIADNRLYRIFKDGTIYYYDPKNLSENIMKHKTKSSEKRYIPNYFINVVITDDTFWLGSNGFGVFKYDPKEQLWTRFYNTEETKPGDHLRVLYADNYFVFVGGGWGHGNYVLNLFSQKLGVWVAIKKVPEKNVISLGATPYNRLAPSRRFYESFLKKGYFEPPAGYPVILREENGDYLMIYEDSEPHSKIRLPKKYLDSLFIQE